MNTLFRTDYHTLKGNIEAFHLALQNGLAELHLRDDKVSAYRMKTLLKALPNELCSKIVLWQHHELVREVAVKGCHFHPFMPFVPGDYQDIWIGKSVLGLGEILRADQSLDYVLFSLFAPYAYHPLELKAFLAAYKGRPQLIAEGNLSPLQMAAYKRIGVSAILQDVPAEFSQRMHADPTSAVGGIGLLAHP